MSEYKNKIVNNYVFQNRFKIYFRNDIEKLLKYQNLTKTNAKGYSSEAIKITGKFGVKDRVISFPNIFSYIYSVKQLSLNKNRDFGKFKSKYNKMDVDLKNRKFRSNSYSENLEKNIKLLTNKFKFMYKIDIKSFYTSLYTHSLEKTSIDYHKELDKLVRIFNNNKTNGILLGNFFSTCVANEIMNYLTIEIEKKLNEKQIDSFINFFSDQFYIFYNDEQESSIIFEIVQKLLGKDYFEFELNVNDSLIFDHESLIKNRIFNRKIDRLFKIQNWEFKIQNINPTISEDKLIESHAKIKHFFNATVEEMYDLPMIKREVFIEVLIKRVFSSTINLLRLDSLISYDKNNDALESLMLFLKLFPSLITLYAELNITASIKKASFSKIEYINIFTQLLHKNIDKIEAVYYYHIICILYDSQDEFSKFSKKLYDDCEKSNILLSIIIFSSCNLCFVEEVIKDKLKDKNCMKKEDAMLIYQSLLNNQKCISDYVVRDLTDLEKFIDFSLKNKIKLFNGVNYNYVNENKSAKYQDLAKIFNINTD